LIDARLYLPEDWCNDDERCKKASIPEDKRQFQSKTQLALAMLKIAQQRGVDEQGCRFVADVHCDQTIYLQDPEPLLPEWSGRGRQPSHRKPQSAPQRVDQWAAAQPPDTWQRLTLRDGEKGLLVADYLHAHVWVWNGEEEQARCWHLLVRREVGADDISHYCLSNAPLDTTWQELARVQAQRFFIEHSFREAKSECGMAD
jgi:SRSO17 transposase